ncbi:MAG: hypothetical protein KJP18_12700, partial [Gemmatimonadetes bacterium]|nr:hypothetical protein [Gemmatimonadota bacterium]
DRFKIYIVDEAHMLTREAWNTLLKILEEPPPRVIFIFATTEPQKIQQSAAPILSRCQRFDFRRIAVSGLVRQLKYVLSEEGQSASDDALRLLARKADGGMRDALSILDQVLAMGGGELDAESVRRVLGLVEEERYLELFDLLVAGRHGDIFGFVESLLDEGYDLVEFYHGLVDTLRVLLRLRLSGPDALPDLPEHLRSGLDERAQHYAPGDLVRMLALASEVESSGSLRRSGQPRLLIEMLLLRLSYLDRTVELEALIRGLGGAPPAPDPSSAGRTSRTPAPEPEPRFAAPPPETTLARSATESGAETDVASRRERPETDATDPAGTPDGPAPVEGRPPPRSGDLLSAWRWVLDRGVGVPPGMSGFLRNAEPTLEGDTVVLALPAPAVERLAANVSERTALKRAVGEGLGRVVDLDVRAEAAGPGPVGGPSRVTPDTVRETRLKELVNQEPTLARAVEELDLELLD